MGKSYKLRDPGGNLRADTGRYSRSNVAAPPLQFQYPDGALKPEQYGEIAKGQIPFGAPVPATKPFKAG